MKLKSSKLTSKIIITTLSILMIMFFVINSNSKEVNKLINQAQSYNNDDKYTINSLKSLINTIDEMKDNKWQLVWQPKKVFEYRARIKEIVQKLDEDPWKIIYVNVGNGNGLVAKSPSGKVIVIDCGGNNEYDRLSYNNMVKALNNIGVKPGGDIDYWITTHDDSDHVGNALIFDDKLNVTDGLMTKYHIKEYIYPTSELACLKKYYDIDQKKYRNLKGTIDRIEKRIDWLKQQGVTIKYYGDKEIIDLGEGDFITFYNRKLDGNYHNENYDYKYYLSSTNKVDKYAGYPSKIIKTRDLKYDKNKIAKGNEKTYFYTLQVSKLKKADGKTSYLNNTIRNAYSLVPMLNFNGHKHLITGDANIKELDDVAHRYGDELKSDIVQSAHHGSNQSASKSFFEASNPYRFINSRSTERKNKTEKYMYPDYITHYYEYIYSRKHSWYNTCDAYNGYGLIFTNNNPYTTKVL